MEPPDPRTTALLLVDVQNDYWTPPREPRPSFAATVAGLLALAREAGWLVVHVQHARRPGSGKGGFVPGTHGFEVHDAAAPRDGEPRVVKHAPSAFFETGLDVRRSAATRRRARRRPAATAASSSATRSRPST